MPLPPFEDLNDEREIPLGMSIGVDPTTQEERKQLDRWVRTLSTRAGIAALVQACEGTEFDADQFMAHLGKDRDIAAPLLELLVVRGVLTLTHRSRIRVCTSSGLLAS